MAPPAQDVSAGAVAAPERPTAAPALNIAADVSQLIGEPIAPPARVPKQAPCSLGR